MNQNTTATFDDIAAALMPDIDEGLASHGEPLLGRPYRSAVFIVEHCIMEVENESKDEYHNKRWFGALLAAVIDWYDKVYGEAMRLRSPQCHTAVVAIRHTPTALEIPLIVRSTISEDNTFWLTFAASMLPDENPLDWLVRPPKLSELLEVQLEQAKSSATVTVELVRRISNGLLMVGNQSQRALQHAALVLPYLQSAAQSILQPDRRGFSTAIWEANFAAENAIKCHLQRTRTPKIPNVHDVRNLDLLAAGLYHPSELDVAISMMPSGIDTVKYRYGEMGDVPLTYVMKVYQASLVICKHYANAIPPKRFRFENTRFRMKVPPMRRKTPK